MRKLILLLASMAAWAQYPIDGGVGGGGGSGAVSSVTAGATGCIVVSPTTGAVIVDIDTACVPSKTGTNNWTGSNVFTSGSRTAPNKAGLLASIPGTCTVADTYFATDAPVGANVYLCTSANTWTITGNVGGAPALTTAGAVPFVTAAGRLTQDASNFVWDTVNQRLQVGASPAYLKIGGMSVFGGIWSQTTPSLTNYSLLADSSDTYINAGGNVDLRVLNGTALRAATTTRNILIGGTTDGNFKLDVQNSGSSGTLRVYDQTGGTGVTKAVIRAGAGQSTTNLQEWQQNDGTARTIITSGGSNVRTGGLNTGFTGSGNGQGSWFYYDSNIKNVSTVLLTWTTSSSDVSGASDLGIGRNAAGVLEINNGTAGTLRDLLARQYKNTPVAVASLQTCNAGNAGSIASVNDANAPAWGSTVASGGAAYAQVTCNGTNWTVTGK